jgi:hypothetical protein
MLTSNALRTNPPIEGTPAGDIGDDGGNSLQKAVFRWVGYAGGRGVQVTQSRRSPLFANPAGRSPECKRRQLVRQLSPSLDALASQDEHTATTNREEASRTWETCLDQDP